MESEWRLNVWRFGMSLSGWRLCARLLAPLPINLADLVVDRGGPFFWFYRDVPGQLPVFSGTRILKGGDHFPPTGFGVFPD